jgi:hypothetical protein
MLTSRLDCYPHLCTEGGPVQSQTTPATLRVQSSHSDFVNVLLVCALCRLMLLNKGNVRSSLARGCHSSLAPTSLRTVADFNTFSTTYKENMLHRTIVQVLSALKSADELR